MLELKKSAIRAIKDVINGGIYKEAFRPTNSGKIDICVNVLTLTQENPQIEATEDEWKDR